jgi:hypothetical protein
VGACGPIPHAIALLDDGVFDAQCLADCTNDVVEHIEEDLALAWADCVIDLGEARHLAKELARLHAFTTEQCALLRTIRDHCNKVTELVRSLRARLQHSKGEAR